MEERLDGSRIFPGARSVLCVALQYAPMEDAEGSGDLWPGVARYARGDDYHETMIGRLALLEERIQEALPDAITRRYVDTGPVLERELAARAGLGAVGKNTNLLHPEGGSYFLLGEIFTSLELAPDVPLADMCGSCTACLEACPTDAFVAPYQLDSRRCISYWNIEHRGPFPLPARKWVEEWVFGCDVCQEVCPWNAEPTPAREASFAIPERRRHLGLVDILRLSRDDYVEIFRRSPIKRAKLAGLKRNATVVMGNRRRREYVPALSDLLFLEEEPVLRGHAAWALGRIGGEEARTALSKALTEEADGGVLEELEGALAGLSGGRAEPTVG